MSLKKWFRSLYPIQFYIVLVFTVIYFITTLICSHITHSLTLLLDSYHVLCNILSLSGCLMAIKYEKDKKNSIEEVTNNQEEESLAKSTQRFLSHSSIKNTFGWARIDVLSMLCHCIFLVSFSFSVVVEALQNLVHIDHMDAVHHPLWVLSVGSSGLILNCLCYVLIGGYTFYQGSFKYITESGDVILSNVVVNDIVNNTSKVLLPSPTITNNKEKLQRQSLRMDIFRDTIGAILVIISALIIYGVDKNIAKHIDPITSILSAILLMYFSFPYLKDSCLILLQTIPGSIDIDHLKKDLILHFPDILNVHDFHVWQLTATKIISTVHIIFGNPLGYEALMVDLKKYFQDNGINQVTIQPEFLDNNFETIINTNCLMKCDSYDCQSSLCCPDSKNKTSVHHC